MNTQQRLILLIGFSVLFMLPMLTGTPTSQSITPKVNPTMSIANVDETTPWWNATYHYRIHVNITDTNSTPRVDVPMSMWFSFDNNTCYKNSIRVTDANGHEVPSQVYNTTSWEDPDYFSGATVFWYANVSADSTATYWIYFSELKSIEIPNYEPVVWFARTTGTLTGKFSPNFWSFRGDWYNVTMLSASGGKITNGAHKMADGSWNWDWGTNRGSMHWNPDGLGGQTTNNLNPIAGTTFVNEEGPLFINYTTQLPFGSYAKMNVTYTFYRWGWITRTYILYSGSTSGSGRTDEWVFYPYITTGAIEVAEDLTQTSYSNWVGSSNKGKPAGFGWWNPNGISHGTVRITHDSWNTDPAYPNNYDNYYYRWWDYSSYEFWDTVIPTIYAQPGTVLEERVAFAAWNGSEGADGYMRVFNATSRYLPLLKEKGEVSSYSFKINVKDLGGSNIEGVNVTLFDQNTGERLIKASGGVYTALTDSNGNVTFIGLFNQTYRIDAWIDSSTWLQPQLGSTGMNVTWSGTRVADGPFTPVGIVLDLASINIHLSDLMGDSLASVGAQTIQVRVYNASDPNRANWRYLDYEATDSSGDLTFFRLPKCDWVFNFTYSNTDTGHIYTEADLGNYISYSIPATDITGDLSRPNWQLPLITLDFNVKAYDGANVETAYVRLSKRGTGDPIATGVTDYYNVTRFTDANGNVTFYRILNGTWNIYLYRNDDFGQTAFNDTESVTNVQGYEQHDLVIPLTWLRVLVQDDSGYRVPSAKVDVKVNGQPLVTAYTDSSGWYNFTWIMANDSSIPVAYTVDVTKQTSSSTNVVVYASFDYLYHNTITITGLAYGSLYTELNATTSTYSWKYGDNRTFIIGWYNRTGSDDASAVDTPLTNYNLGRMNFSIYWQNQLVGIGWWNSTSPSYIAHSASDGIYFTLIIDTIHFKMNASGYPYLIKINASAPGYSTTDIYTITVVITPASTVRNGVTSDVQYWSDGFTLFYSLTTSPEGRNTFNLTALDYFNYTVYDGSSAISSGTLSDIGGGIYRFTDAILNASDAGDYSVLIWLHKFNYQNHSFTVSLTINAVPTSLSWSSPPGDYTWGSGSEITTLLFYDNWHNTSILTADSIVLQWINVDTGEIVLTDTSTLLTYTYNRDIVANGTWQIHAYVSKSNFIGSDALSLVFTVSPVTTQIILTSSNEVTVAWGSEYATFDFDYEHVSPTLAVAGGEIIAIDWTGEYSLVDNGDGSYQLRLLPVQEAANYTFTFYMWIANRTKASATVTVNVLIPLEVRAVAGSSIQDPISEYWTRNFTLQINAGDLSNVSTYVSGVTVTYTFAAGGISGVMTENMSGQYYYIEFPASSAPGPGIYEINIDATRVGCTGTTTSIFIEVIATPTLAAAETQLLTVYYADILDLNFTWTTSIDDHAGVSAPDSVTISLWKGINQINSDIGGVIDFGNGSYTFQVNTKTLQMTADSPLAPTGYYFVITINKLGYGDPLAVTIIVLVLQTPTEMTADQIDPVVWSETLTINVHLKDIIHSEYVWENATVTLIYGGFAQNFTSLGNGTFTISFDSQLAFNSSDTPHHATIEYTLPNYIDGSIGVDVLVNPVAASIVLDTLENAYDWNSTFALTLAIVLDSNSLIRVNVTRVYFYWTGYPTIQGTLVYDSTWSDYRGTVDTGKVPAGARTLNIVAERQNYSIPVVQINLTVRELDTELTPDTEALFVIFGVDQSAEVRFTYVSGSNVLEGATMTFLWAGLERSASWADGEYVFQFNPSGDSSLVVPGTYVLNFSASLMNYTSQTASVVLHLSAATDIVGGPFRVEEGQSFILIFAYWDMVNDRPVGATASVQYIIGGVTHDVDASQFNGTHYLIPLTASEVGEIRTEPYLIQILASAPGYQNWTQSVSKTVQVYILSPTVNVLGLFTVQRDILFLVIAMTGFFAFIAGAGIGIQRWRIPHVIKQINKAIKQMEAGKVASVEGIKSMGQVIAEILAPGLAELDIEAPIIDSISEGMFLGAEEPEDILSELDTLDDLIEEPDVVPEDSTVDFEAELEAELDTIVEETPVEAEPEVPAVKEPEAESEDMETDIEKSDIDEDSEPESEEVESVPEPDESPEVEEPSEDVVKESIEESDESDEVDAPLDNEVSEPAEISEPESDSTTDQEVEPTESEESLPDADDTVDEQEQEDVEDILDLEDEDELSDSLPDDDWDEAIE